MEELLVDFYKKEDAEKIVGDSLENLEANFVLCYKFFGVVLITLLVASAFGAKLFLKNATESEDMKNLTEQLRKQADDLTKTIAEEKKIRDATDLKKDDSNRKELNKLNAEITDLKAHIETLKTRAETQDAAVAEMKKESAAKIAALKEEVEKNKAQLGRQGAENTRLTSEMDEMKSRFAAVAEMKKESAAKIAALKEEVEKNKAQLGRQGAENTRLTSEMDEMKSRFDRSVIRQEQGSYASSDGWTTGNANVRHAQWDCSTRSSEDPSVN